MIITDCRHAKRITVHWPPNNTLQSTNPGLLEDEYGQGGGCEVAAHGEAEQASQSEQCLAVGAHLAFGVLEGLALIGTTRLEHAAVLQDGGCTRYTDHRGRDHWCRYKQLRGGLLHAVTWSVTTEPLRTVDAKAMLPISLLLLATAVDPHTKPFTRSDCNRCANVTKPLGGRGGSRGSGGTGRGGRPGGWGGGGLPCDPPPIEPIREARMCSTVMYTALIGRYDDFSAFAGHHSRHRAESVCYIVLLDEKRANGNYTYWLPVVVRPLFLNQPARSAHILKSVPFQLFPEADWVVYIDAKTKLHMPVPTWIDRMRRSDEMPARSGALLYVLRHPHGLVGTAEDGLVREINAERRWVIKRRRQHWQSDVADIDQLAARYCATAPLCRIGNVVETSLMVWRGGAAHGQLSSLACHWFHEIHHGSQREQLSFPYVVQALGLRQHVHYVAHADYKQHWGWLDHSSCDSKGACHR